MATSYHSESSPTTIFLAETQAEKDAIYRFRYRVYAEEMGRRLPSIDHSNKLIIDELDDWGLLLYAKSGEEIIGTVRINIGPLEKFPANLAHLLYLDRFQKFSNKCDSQTFAYTSKLMVAEPYRNSAVLYLLSTKSYELYCVHKVQFNFGTCKLHLLPLYEQFGSRRFRNNFIAPGYDGVMIPVVVLVDDIEHLRAVRSPFYRFARTRKQNNSRVAEWFCKEFSEYSGVVNSQLVSPQELWLELYRRLRRNPLRALPILHGLSKADAQRFLHCCGVIIHCQPGDYITLNGDVSYLVCILLDGNLKASSHKRITFPRGSCFGRAGLVSRPRYTEDIYAVTNAEILLISGLSFQRFQQSHPDIANIVLENLTTSKGHSLSHSATK
jgi:hypothetical protein